VAGMGPAPKPEKRRRNADTFAWVELPAEGREGDPPPLPEWVGSSKWLSEAWARLWATPQATQWDPSGRSLWVWAQVMALVQSGEASAAQMGELRQIEDRHGLNPKALLQLRWRIVEGAEPMAVADAGSTSRARKPGRRKAGESPEDRRLRIVAEGDW
jgi:hypothetical protein